MLRGRIASLVFIAVGICRTTPRAFGIADTSPAGNAPALQASAAKSPVDQLIPWLLDEDRQVRGIPFSEVIVDVTGKKVLAFDPQNEIDRRVVRQISAVLDEVTRRMNAPDSPIQNHCTRR